MSVFIKTTLKKQSLPNINFKKIKDEILGKDYELSLLICSDKLAQNLNKKYRKKSYIPNTLSFPYGQDSGEIILNVSQAKREAKLFKHNFKQHLIFLFIHSLLHLKGMTHGYKMEKEERRYLAKFYKSVTE